MRLLAAGVTAKVLGGGLLLSRRPLTRWNARGADAMARVHIRQAPASGTSATSARDTVGRLGILVVADSDARPRTPVAGGSCLG